jgi:glucose/mannose transport system substrate-binding protein
MGDWAKGGFLQAKKNPGKDFSCEISPGSGMVLTAVDGFAFPKTSSSSDQSTQGSLASAMMNKEVQTKAALIKGALPARTDASTEGFDHCSQNALNLLASGSAALHWNVRDSGFKGVLKDVVSQFWNSDMSAEKARKMLVDGLKQL